MADVAEEVTVRVGGAGVTERIGKEERRPVEDDQVVAASQVCFHLLRQGPPCRDGSSNPQSRDDRWTFGGRRGASSARPAYARASGAAIPQHRGRKETGCRQ